MPDLSHGTQVLSKLAGKVYGVIKKPSVVVVVRTPARKPFRLYVEDLVDMITWTIEDWQNHRDEMTVKVAVMTMSVGIARQYMVEEDLLKLPRLESLFVDAMNEGILPIVAGGNTAGVCE